MPNGSLLITDVSAEDTGEYTCVAGNSCNIKGRVAQLYVVGELMDSVYKGLLLREQSCLHWAKASSREEDKGVNYTSSPLPVSRCDRLITSTTSLTPSLSLR